MKKYALSQEQPTEEGRRRRAALKIEGGRKAAAGGSSSRGSSNRGRKLGRNKLPGGNPNLSLLSNPGGLSLPNRGGLSSPGLSPPQLPLCPSKMEGLMRSGAFVCLYKMTK